MKVSKIKRLLALALAAAALGCLCGCGKKPALQEDAPAQSGIPVSASDVSPSVVMKGSDSIFSINYHSAEPTNPYLLKTQTNRMVSGLVYEGLFSVTPSFEAENVLCESYKTSDGVTFSFTVRRGTLFHDGEELTAEDAVYSIQTAMANQYYSGRLACIASVSADSRYIFTVVLKAANSSLPLLLDLPVIRSGSAEQNTPAGTGPYSVSSSGEHMFLKAFPDWRESEKLSLSRIYLKEYEVDLLSSAFETGYIDLVPTDPAGITYISYGGDNEVWYYDTSSMQFLGFNTNHSFLGNSWARRAVSMAVDREYIASVCMDGCARVSTLPVSPASPLWSGELDAVNAFSAQSMAELLRDNGAVDADGDGYLEYGRAGEYVDFTIDFIVNTENMNRLDAARKITAALKTAGFEVTLRELPWEDYVSALERGDFDMYYGEVMLTADFDLTSLLTPGGALNYGGASDPTCAGLIGSYLAAVDVRKAAEAAKLYEYLSEYCPVAPILFRREALLTRRGAVSDAKPTQYNAFNGISDWNIKTD